MSCDIRLDCNSNHNHQLDRSVSSAGLIGFDLTYLNKNIFKQQIYEKVGASSSKYIANEDKRPGGWHDGLSINSIVLLLGFIFINLNDYFETQNGKKFSGSEKYRLAFREDLLNKLKTEDKGATLRRPERCFCRCCRCRFLAWQALVRHLRSISLWCCALL